MLDAYLFDGTRTPFGRHAGGLAPVRPDNLLAGVIKTVVERNKLDPMLLDDVIVGCANQAGEDSRCVARHAGLMAGLPVEIGGSVVQRNCGINGFDTIPMINLHKFTKTSFSTRKSHNPIGRRYYGCSIGCSYIQSLMHFKLSCIG